jgi:hypothetical protein
MPLGTAQQFVIAETNGNVAGILAAFGLVYDPTDPYADIYPVITARNAPAGLSQPVSHFQSLCEACLRARGFLYYKVSPGDCGTVTPVQNGTAVGLNLGVQAGSSAISAVSALTGTASAALGAVTAGAGSVVGIIASLFTAKAQAIKAQQDATCTSMQAVNATIPQLDYYVRTGQASLEDGITAIQGIAAQVLSLLESTFQSSGCNEPCYYEAIMKAHVDFATNFYYPTLSEDVPPTAPAKVSGTAPASTVAAAVQNAPGSPMLVGSPKTPFQLTTADLLLAIAGLGIVVLLLATAGG